MGAVYQERRKGKTRPPRSSVSPLILVITGLVPVIPIL
jgi:hypothetical protein